MASRNQVKNALDIQVANDARARRLQAGDAWTTMQLDFFYGIGNEISVDIAVKTTVLRLLANEHAILPDEVWVELRHDINQCHDSSRYCH